MFDSAHPDIPHSSLGQSSSWIIDPFDDVSDLKVICAQSCGHLEAYGDPRSPKTSWHQPWIWGRMKKNEKTLYIDIDWEFE